MVDEYKAGRTPNPDIMCNQEVKFKLFLEACLEDGADMIATGHYARIHDGQLLTAANKDKDQTYFLYRVSEEALRKSLMPIGEFKTKHEVREIAKNLGLATEEKKYSQVICFVGKVGIREFLEHELGPQKPGVIKDQNGVEIGEHDGAIYYTIGQRHGLNVGGGLPYYVVGKDMNKNEVYVTTDLDDKRLWYREVTLTDAHWINDAPTAKSNYQIRTRYRAPLVNVKSIEKLENSNWRIVFEEDIRAITPGQSAVLYEDKRVVGGGIVI
jgi:tRNA-specific 2-thiouridylase